MAILVLGVGGAAKSTTAAALSARGGTLRSDDIVVIDSSSGMSLLLPTESRVRLIDESGRVRSGRVRSGRVGSGQEKHDVEVATSPASACAPAVVELVACLTLDDLQTPLSGSGCRGCRRLRPSVNLAPAGEA